MPEDSTITTRLRDQFIKTVRKNHRLFQVLLFATGVAFAYLATLEYPYLKINQNVSTSVLSSIAGALMVAPILFALRQWFTPGSSGGDLMLSENVAGSQHVGLTRVYGRLQDIGKQDDWLNLIRNAHERVDLMGRTLNSWTSAGDEFRDLVIDKTKKVEFRWLIMGLDNNYLPTLKEKNDTIGSSLRKKITETIRELDTIKRGLLPEQQKRFQIRCFRDFPLYFSYMRFDQHFFVSQYLFTQEAQECPLHQISGLQGPWTRTYQNEFDTLWKMSSEPILKESPPVASALELEGQLMQQMEQDYRKNVKRVTHNKIFDSYNFDKGWHDLFSKLFSENLNGSADRILRDYTTSKTGDLIVQNWDLHTYPAMLMGYFRQDTDMKVHGKFLICCEECGPANRVAESFFAELLAFAYSRGERSVDFKRLFRTWKNNFGRDHANQIQIRLTNPQVLEEVLRENTQWFRNPFNIYGDFALSRSILGPADSVGWPVPHLQIVWDNEKIGECLGQFDSIWEHSDTLQGRIFRSSNRKLSKHATGALFDLWARL